MNHSLSLLVLGACALSAAEPRMNWLPSGASAKLGYYRPMRLTISATAPASLRKPPADLKAPSYAMLTLGPKESPVRVVVLLDEPAGVPARLWVDANANGDLTDDPAVEWKQRSFSGKTSYGGRFEVQVAYGSEMRALGFNCYRFDPKEKFKDSIFYYRDYAWSGEVTLGPKTVKAMLVDEMARGDFRGGDESERSPVSLLLDLNGDGRFDSRGESFDVRKPFATGGATYEVGALAANGSGLAIVPSTKVVEEKPVPPVLTPGSKVPGFEATTMDGKKVRFPDDYKGRLVMLDFWATWCGPCRAEVPNLVKVHGELHAKGFDVLGITLDNANGRAAVEKYSAEQKMDWPQIFDGKGWQADLAQRYGIHAIPACFLVDGNTGQIVATSGELRGGSLKPTVERHLASLGKPAAAPKADAPKPEAPRPPDPVLDKAAALAKAGRLLDTAAFKAQLQSPRAAHIEVAAPGTQPLAQREIARRARAAHVRTGWYYRCTKCDRWHTNLAGGYAIARDTIVTARHVIEPPETSREGSPIAVDDAGEVLPITAVLAADETGDAVVLRVGTDRLKPLALSTAAEQGDAAYCFSDPLSQRGYFSDGIVNRIFSLPNASADDPHCRRLNVSTDWAPGSSGAAVLDAQGNAIGHVARISTLNKDSNKAKSAKDEHDAPTLITLHEAIPASIVQALVEKANAPR